MPTLIQFPIWLALYQAIIRVLAVTPEDFLNLSGHLYNWQVLYHTLPLSSKFLWIDLSSPDYLLALLVGAAMFLQQKMTTPPATDPKMAAQSQLMLFMMPAFARDVLGLGETAYGALLAASGAGALGGAR